MQIDADFTSLVLWRRNDLFLTKPVRLFLSCRWTKNLSVSAIHASLCDFTVKNGLIYNTDKVNLC